MNYSLAVSKKSLNLRGLLSFPGDELNSIIKQNVGHIT